MKDLKNQPEIQASMLNTLGTVYHNLGLYERAATLHESALKTRQKLFGEVHEETAESYYGLARACRFWSCANLVETYYRKALEIQRRRLDAEHPDVATTLFYFAVMTMYDKRDFRSAEAMFRESLAIRRRRFGEESDEAAESTMYLALLRNEQEQFEQAEPLARAALAIALKLHPNEYALSIGGSQQILAIALHGQGRYAEAEALLRQALEAEKKVYPEGGMRVANISLWHGLTLLKLKKYEEAETALRFTLEIRRKILLPDAPDVVAAEADLAVSLVGQRRFAEAEPMLLRGYEKLKDTSFDKSKMKQQAISRLSELYEMWGKPEKAAIYRALLR